MVLSLPVRAPFFCSLVALLASIDARLEAGGREFVLLEPVLLSLVRSLDSLGLLAFEFALAFALALAAAVFSLGWLLVGAVLPLLAPRAPPRGLELRI